MTTHERGRLSEPLAAATVHRLSDVASHAGLPAVVVTACVGVAMADQAARQAMRLVGDTAFIGPEYLMLGLQQMCPLVTALVLSQSAGAAFCAEIANLNANDALMACRHFGRSPERQLFLPIRIACTAAAVLFALCSVVVWECVGAADLAVRVSQNPRSFFHPEVIDGLGVGLLLVKSAVCGALVAETAVRSGMQAQRGSDGIGDACALAVIRGIAAALLCCTSIDVLVWVWQR